MAVENAAPLARSLRGIAVPRIVRVIGGRLISAILVIWGVVTLTFLLTRVFSGDPTNLFAQPTDTAADRAAIRQRLGLADPIPVQYVHYLNDVIHGNLGTSYLTFRPVTSDLLNKLPATGELAVYALIFGVAVGVAAGVLSAVFEGSIFDRAVRILTSAGLALPQFWVALMLILIFYVQLHVLPGPTGRLAIGMQPPPTVTGFYSIDSIITGHLSTFWPAVRQLILPTATLGYVVASPLRRRYPVSDDLGAESRLRPDRARPRAFPWPHLVRLRVPQRHAAGHHHARRPGRVRAVRHGAY